MNKLHSYLLRVSRLKKYFPQGGRLPLRSPKAWVRAVDDISFSLKEGETFSLVGESGCGKTTTAKMILLMERPTSGAIYFRGEDLQTLKRPELRAYRGAVQAVFQDPWSSLNPRKRASSIIAEPLLVNEKLPRQEIKQRVEELLDDVGLDPGSGRNFPHEFSGGQRQRVAIARALSLNPSLLILDEPVSALDVSVRAQIMNMLKELQAERGMSYFLIAHNLATVRYLSNRVAIMYLGEIVEEAESEELFENPMHPYTQALISAALTSRPSEQEEEIAISGEVPSPMNPPAGCRFHPRCPFAFDRCLVESPKLLESARGHHVACHLHD